MRSSRIWRSSATCSTALTYDKLIHIASTLDADIAQPFPSGEAKAVRVGGLRSINRAGTETYQPLRLARGDSIYFDSRMGHAYIAGAPGLCRILTVCSGRQPSLTEALQVQMHGKKRAGA